jgi:hypothetical protein
MFRNIKKHEIIIEEALVAIIKALLYAINTFTSESVNTLAEITIKFDDSIVVDENTERTQDMLDVSAGIMSKVEYRMKWYNEDEKTATEKIEDLDSFTITDEEEVEPIEEE